MLRIWLKGDMSISRPSIESDSAIPAEGPEYWQELVRDLRQVIKVQQQTIEKLEKKLVQQQGRIEQLEAEIRASKKLKGKPQLSASRLNEAKAKEAKVEKRAGSAKRSKKDSFEVDEERIIEPLERPEDARFNGYRSYDVQEIEIRRHNIRFQLAEYVTREGSTVVGELPKAYVGGHYGPKLVSYILYQHYQCRVPQSLIYEQLQEWEIEISAGQVNRILTEQFNPFAQEQADVLQAGLTSSEYIHTDDTGARHQGKNGYCTVIGNEWFSYFQSSGSKSRENFLEVLQGGARNYVLNEDARSYIARQTLPLKQWEKLTFSDELLASGKSEWQIYLLGKGILSARAIQVISEAALLGGVMSQGINAGLRILSDGAGQFNILCHGLCWVHAERALRRLEGESEPQRQNINEMQDLLWQYYRKLQEYRQNPTPGAKLERVEEFDQIFGRCYLDQSSLNAVLHQFIQHKAELLRVLDCPRLPLHTNAAETDIREYVTRRKISGGTRSDAGRKARDTFVGLKKTCRKLGISFWQFLLSRLHFDELIPPLSDLLRAKAAVVLQGADMF
jgi:uncharacterized coiled-coil protein SlyX